MCELIESTGAHGMNDCLTKPIDVTPLQEFSISIFLGNKSTQRMQPKASESR